LPKFHLCAVAHRARLDHPGIGRNTGRPKPCFGAVTAFR